MKATKITYYVTTGIISAMMIFIGFETLLKSEVRDSMAHLGLPADYFRVELGVAKLIGAIMIWLPIRLLKEAAYIGFAIMFASASLAHYAVGDPVFQIMAGLAFLTFLTISYITNNRLHSLNTINLAKS